MHNSRISVEALQRSSQRRGGKIHPFRDALDPARTAHLVIDLQNGFLEAGAPVEVPQAREIVSTVNAISAAVRKAGGINVFVRYVARDQDARKWSTFYSMMLPQKAGAAIVEAFSPGQHGMNLWPQLDVLGTDLIVDKERFSAFTPGTCDLHDKLQARGIDTVIVTGTMTNCCCECTARDAMQLNYRVLFVADATAALSDTLHNATLDNMCEIFADVVTAQEAAAALALRRQGGRVRALVPDGPKNP